MPVRFSVATLVAACLLQPSASHAVLVFDHDFGNATSGAVTSTAQLGAPTVGTWSYSGSPVGGISGGNKAIAIAQDSNNQIAGMTEMAGIGTGFGGTSPQTRSVTAGRGDRLLANLSQPSGFTNGNSTTISFGWASFGTGNTGGFKHTYVRGLDASGNEAFELVFQAGSVGGTKEVFHRSADQNDVTVTTSGSGNPFSTLDATKLVDGLGFAHNGTNAGSRPNSLLNVDITLSDLGVQYSFTSGGSVTLTPEGDDLFAINPAAGPITQIEWSAGWNSSVGTQNKGYWVDNVSVVSIPEVSGFLALGLVSSLVVGVGTRRRRSS